MDDVEWPFKENSDVCRVQYEMIPVLTTCCCGVVSIRTAALLVAALFIFGSGVNLFVYILIASGAIRTVFGDHWFIDIIIMNVLTIAINILLIVGIEKRKLSLLKSAAVFYLLVVAFNFVTTCSLYTWVHYSAWKSLVLVVGGSITAIFCYFWLIIYSYYRQLENELLASSVGEENSPLTVVSHPCPKKEDERELAQHST